MNKKCFQLVERCIVQPLDHIGTDVCVKFPPYGHNILYLAPNPIGS